MFSHGANRVTQSVICILVLCLVCLVSGCGPSTFRVNTIALRAPDWVPPAEYNYKVTLYITFNRAVKQSTLTAPGSVNVDLTGTSSGRKASGIAGSFRFSADPDVAAEAVFISDKTGTALINPQAGENIEYTITISGSGATAVKDANGVVLDGDADGTAGGDYKKQLEQVG